jgi:voltage-gated potassium channel
MGRPSILRLRFRHFVRDVLVHTPFAIMVVSLASLWVLFSTGFYFAETASPDSPIENYYEALYWGVAAFSTSGIADVPVTGAGRLIGGVWIVVGSILFFGTVVATVTAYFLRPLQRPVQRIVETIELNLEQLEDLSVDELEVLKETTDGLIEHVERLKREQSAGNTGGPP